VLTCECHLQSRLLWAQTNIKLAYSQNVSAPSVCVCVRERENLWGVHEVHLQKACLQRPLRRPVVFQGVQ
jgi:hypothetical protein